MGSIEIHPPKTPITAGSNGVAAATVPNVCKMPGPPAPFVPTPLPNIGTSNSSPKGYSKKVKFEGKAVCIRGASFASKGDIASKGTGGGVVSSNTHGPTKPIGPGSLSVKVEGKNVHLLGDPTLNNCGPSGSPANAATLAGTLQAPGGGPIVIQMDCDGYPDDDVPYFPMEENPERWTVRPTNNGQSTRLPEHSDTSKLESAFARRVDQGLSSRETQMLDDLLSMGPTGGRRSTLNVSRASGDQVVSSVQGLNRNVFSGHSSSYKSNYHHLRPTWAGGGNSPNNLWPSKPGHQTVGIHSWWTDRIDRSVTPDQRALLTGKNPPPTVNTISENNIGKMAEKCQNMDPPRELVIEMDCPQALAASGG